MVPSCPHEVSSPIPATTLLVDIRNFTPNLNAARTDEQGINVFCHFLSAFYAICLNASLVALPPALRLRPPLSMSSTGDGVLIIFTHEAHVRQGFLTALLLHVALQQQCAGYNAHRSEPPCPQTSFGIGIESGCVSRVRAQSPGDPGYPLVDTYIGSCINVAARAEAVSKLLHRANTIIAQTLNTRLCAVLFGENYDALIARALDPGLGDTERLALHDRMNDLNRRLCLTFIHHHHLRGVEQPTALFRLANSTIQLGNPRFDALLALVTEDTAHLTDVIDFLHSYGEDRVLYPERMHCRTEST
jgi:class 3 adenylate cyclase